MPLKKVKSRYFAVSAESQRPTPRLSAAICSTTNGKPTIAPLKAEGGAGGGEELEVGPEAEKGAKLQGEGQQIGDDCRQRNDQARKIDLAEEVGVVNERAGGALEGLGEVVPAEQPGEVEKHRRQSVGRNLGHLAEDHREDDRRQQRLENEPGGPKDRLLVFGDEVAMDQQKQKVAIAPDVTQIQVATTRAVAGSPAHSRQEDETRADL